MKLKIPEPPEAVLRQSEFYKRYMRQQQKQEQRETCRQLELGFCDTIHPSSRLGNIKAELTADKNRIFVVDSFSGNSREYERKIKTSTGENLTQKVLIGRTKGGTQAYGVLKQKHQALMYDLFRFWTEGEKRLVQTNNRPRAFIVTTAYKLVKSLCSHVSSDSYRNIRSTLRDLASIPISIENAYTKNGISKLEFTILGEVVWKTRSRKGTGPEKNTSEVYIQFSDIATEGLMHGYVKDFSLDVYKKIGGSGKGRYKTAATVLYSILDTELAAKETYHASLTNLFSEMGFRNYKHKSKRKEKIELALERVNGEVICGGTHRIHAYLRLSEKLNDYILEARRSPVC